VRKTRSPLHHSTSIPQIVKSCPPCSKSFNVQSPLLLGVVRTVPFMDKWKLRLSPLQLVFSLFYFHLELSPIKDLFRSSLSLAPPPSLFSLRLSSGLTTPRHFTFFSCMLASFLSGGAFRVLSSRQREEDHLGLFPHRYLLLRNPFVNLLSVPPPLPKPSTSHPRRTSTQAIPFSLDSTLCEISLLPLSLIFFECVSHGTFCIPPSLFFSYGTSRVFVIFFMKSSRFCLKVRIKRFPQTTQGKTLTSPLSCSFPFPPALSGPAFQNNDVSSRPSGFPPSVLYIL